MDLIDLELVVAVADAGSITHGAVSAHLSLPSASARIRRLEHTVGAALFDRDRRGVAPTPAGTLLLRHARAVGEAVERLRTELAEHIEGRGPTVRVLANSAAVGRLTPAVTTFLAMSPDVRIDVDEQPGHRIVAAVAERRTDLGIVADSVDLGGLETRSLRPDPLVVLTTPHDRLARCDTTRYTDVVDRTFVGLSHAGGFPLGGRPTYRVRLPSLDAVCHAVAAGTGIAIVPRHSVTDWITSGRLSAIDLDERWAHRHLVVCFTTDHELSATARALRDHLIAND